MNKTSAGLACFSAILFAHPGAAEDSPDFQRGQEIVQTYCADCHAVGKTDTSPLSLAPPLRNLHKRYPVEHLEEAFAEGIYTGHPEMPQFQFEPDQINDLIAFLKSLE